MSIRAHSCCQGFQRQLPVVAPESLWLSDEHLFAAFQRFYAISKTTRRYGSSVPGPLEARRRLDKRRIAHLSEGGPTYEAQSGVNWGLFGHENKTHWRWQPPTGRAEHQEKPRDRLSDWLSTWINKPVINAMDEEIDLEGESVHKPPSIEDEVREFQKQFANLNPKDWDSRWDEVSARLKRELTLGLLSEKSIIRIRDMIWNMGQLSPEYQRYRVSLYDTIWKGLIASKVFTPLDLEASTIDSFVMHIASMPFSPIVQSLLTEVLRSSSTAQLQQMGSSISCVLGNWSRTWLFDEATDSLHLKTSSELSELFNLSFDANEKLDELRNLVITICEDSSSSPETGLTFDLKIAAVEAAFEHTQTAVSNFNKVLNRIEQNIRTAENSIQDLVKALEKVPQHVLFPILSTHTKLQNTENSWVHYFMDCYVSILAHLPVSDSLLSYKLWHDMELGGIYTLEPEKSFQILCNWNSSGLLGEDSFSKIIKLTEDGVLNSERENVATLLFSLHEQGKDTWGLLDVVFFTLQKQERYDEIFPIISQLHDFGYKIPSVMFDNLVRTLYTHDLHAAYLIYCLSHDMIVEGDVMQAYRNQNFIFRLINGEEFTSLDIWERVLRIPWYDFISKEIRPTLPKDPLSSQEQRFFGKMALIFAHAERLPPGLAFHNVNQVLWHIRQRTAKPTSDISKAMCHVVITRVIASSDPNHGHSIGPTRLGYVLRLVKVLEGKLVAKQIAKLVIMWREYLIEQCVKQSGSKTRLKYLTRYLPKVR